MRFCVKFSDFWPNNRFFLTKLHQSSKTTLHVQSSIIYACMVSLGKPSCQVIRANNPNSKGGVYCSNTMCLMYGICWSISRLNLMDNAISCILKMVQWDITKVNTLNECSCHFWTPHSWKFWISLWRTVNFRILAAISWQPGLRILFESKEKYQPTPRIKIYSVSMLCGAHLLWNSMKISLENNEKRPNSEKMTKFRLTVQLWASGLYLRNFF